jgi:hypothetical protein
MKQAHDYTKWHKFIEAIDSMSPMGDDYKQSEGILRTIRPQLTKIGTSIPIFVGGEIVSDNRDLNKKIDTLRTLISNVGLPLPFAEQMFEFTIEGFRHFALITRQGNMVHFSVMILIEPQEIPVLIFLDIKLEFENGELIYSADKYWPGAKQYNEQDCKQLVLVILIDFILKTVTKGVETVEIKASDRLNKSRTAKRKQVIPNIMLMQPTHYYDNSGAKHEITRNTPRLHWRRGHVRTVWFGPRGNQESKQKYIFPCIVNFKDGDHTPGNPIRILQ